MKSAWLQVLEAARTLHLGSAELQGFAPFPDMVEFVKPEPLYVPASDILRNSTISGTAQTQPLVDAIRLLCPVAEWKQAYSEQEVGADMLARFGYIELVGPTGVFRHPSFQAYISFWDAHLFYDWHHHEAEELYFNLAGDAIFFADGQDDITLNPDETRIHTTNQNHAMRTETSPILTYIVWRGNGVGELPKMGRVA